MIPLRHHYRDFGKNPLLEEGILLFMSSTPTTEGGGSSGDDEEEGTPPPPPPGGTPPPPANPPEGGGSPKGKPQINIPGGPENLLKSKFERGEPQKLYKDFKDLVKDNAEMDAQEEFETYWISKLGDYNGIQVQIDRLVEKKKLFSDDKFVKDSPDFKAEFQKAYQELLQIAKTASKAGGVPIDPATLKSIQEQAKQTASENYKIDAEPDMSEAEQEKKFKKKISRKEVIKNIDKVLDNLIKERERQFKELMDYMVENLQRRIIHLIEKWQVAPPHGYEDVQEEWIEYCVNLLEALEKSPYKKMDFKDPNFPSGDEGFKEAKNWWYSVSLYEDTYEDFVRGAKEELSLESLKSQFGDLEKAAKKQLTHEKVKDYQEKIDSVINEIDAILPLMEAKKNDKSIDAAERGMRKSEIFALKMSKEKLLSKRDVESIVNETLYGTGNTIPFDRSGIHIDIPSGLKGQLDFFNIAPLDKQERRLIMRSLNDGMKEMKVAMENIGTEADVTFTQSLENLRLYRQNLQKMDGPVSEEVIWINPYEAWGHVWHSVTSTIKGNYETEAKRGAGYLQKQGTKWMENVPNPLDGKLIKSFKEFSANGEQEAEHAEHGRVSDIQKGYEGFNTEHLYHLASQTSDRWEFKACLNLMADRGRINWYDKWIYKQLNRWQTTIKLPEDPDWHRTYITASDDMLRQAFVYIYRVTDDYKSLKNKNTGSWESKLGEFQKGLGLLAAEKIIGPDGKSQGGLKNEADKLLNQYLHDKAHNEHAGVDHLSKADPIKYEAIISYAIEQGKMQGEDRMYYINQGIASGFLPFDRGAVLTKFNNTYPPVDRYDTDTIRGGRPNIFDIKEWACHDKVTNLYDVFETLSDNTAANQRVNKTISQGQNRVDHDDAPMLAGHIDAETMQRILSANGQGGYGLPSTGLQSLVVGHELWLDMYAHRYNQKKKEFNDAQITRFVNMFMRFDGITSRQMQANNTQFWRLDQTVAKTQEPRAGGSYGELFGHESLRKSNKIADYIGSVKGYIELLDFDPGLPLLKKLNSKELNTPAKIQEFITLFKGAHGAEVSKKIFGDPPVSEIDKVYEVVITNYVSYICKEKPERIQLMVNTINADHKKVWDAQDERRKAAEKAHQKVSEKDISLTYRLQQVAKRQKAVRHEAYLHAQGKTDPHAHHGDHGGHGEEGDHGGGHHRKSWHDDDDEDEELEPRWSFSRRDHQERSKRSSFAGF